MNKNNLCGDKQEISPRCHVRAILSTYDVTRWCCTEAAKSFSLPHLSQCLVTSIHLLDP